MTPHEIVQSAIEQHITLDALVNGETVEVHFAENQMDDTLKQAFVEIFKNHQDLTPPTLTWKYSKSDDILIAVLDASPASLSVNVKVKFKNSTKYELRRRTKKTKGTTPHNHGRGVPTDPTLTEVQKTVLRILVDQKEHLYATGSRYGLSKELIDSTVFNK